MSEFRLNEASMESGVRIYAPFTAWHAIRRYFVLRRAGAVGEDVYVEKGVRLLRHPEKVALGHQVMLKEGTTLCPTHPDASITIGDWTTIGYHVFAFAKSQISIGNNCLIAPFCYFVDSDHGTNLGALIRQQPMVTAPIVVGSDVWLGTGVKVTKGVTIGDGAIVAAGSLVTEDIRPHAVYGGVPARFIKKRGDS